MTNPTRDAAELIAPMLKKPLWVALRQFEKPEILGDHLVEHLEWMIALEQSGKLFAAGPFVDDNEEPAGGSMMIMRAPDRAAAEAIQNDDPLIKAGVARFELHDWRMSEGRVTLSVDMSRQEVTVA